MIATFTEFLENVIVESLHPELKALIEKPAGKLSKQTALAVKIKDLTAKGEKTGIEGNMPKGSSRAYLQHKDPHEIELDGKPAKIKTGTKVAIKSTLDKYHDHKEHDGHSLGQLQNKAEGGDGFINNHYRILKHEGGNKFSDNKESGIFPPLIDHDDDNHHWSHVGHSRDIKGDKEFRHLTKTESHPNGIGHNEFVSALGREYDRNHGKYWGSTPEHEQKLDHVRDHPLVQKFLDHQGNFDAPPHDYHQIKNMGVFEHPDGSKHIVARDHGWDHNVQGAYKDATSRQWNDRARIRNR